MLSRHPNDPAAASDGSPPGLENRVRNMILSSTTHSGSTSNPTPAARHSLPPDFSSSANSSHDTLHDIDPSSHGLTGDDNSSRASAQPSRGGRKRPNQAQRRQMNLQFTIPIDPRPQESSPSRPYQSPNAQYSRPSQSYHRHLHSNSAPRSMHHEGRSNYSYAPNPWNSPSHHGPPPDFPPNQSQGSYEQRRNGPSQLYNHRRPPAFRPEDIAAQAALLDQLCFKVVPDSEIEFSEIKEKEAFRCRIEAISREVITRHEIGINSSVKFDPFSVELKCFGSLSSGFATKASDMDLGLLSPMSPVAPDAAGSVIPRLLEMAFLDAGIGARLLTRTRVPIIKLCQSPPEKLYKDLLDERFKWENGIDEEDHENHEEDDHEQHHASYENDGDQLHAEDGSSSATALAATTEGLESLELRQGPNNSLSSYYSLAKRALRRAGGRDATMSNWRVFTDQDWDILDRVCQAFVAGLANTELREQLLEYSPLLSSDIPSRRSLLGVYTQAEGEQVIRVWSKRAITERRQAQHVFMESSIKLWRELQSQGFGMDPVYHTKQLQVGLDRLKKAPSVQFATLEQGQHETPAQYFARAQGIIDSLQPMNPGLASSWQDATIRQYVVGIYQEEIRNLVQESIDSSNETLPIKAISRRHESLHLAWELERALKKELYEATYVADVRAYIDLLRSPAQNLQTQSPDDAFVIPLNAESSALVNRIRMIPDPHRMAPNQPKDRYRDRLEFPKTGAGVQCDINFSAHLALQNTLLLRCYSHTDPRVRPMVLFVKHWAKTRGINSGYRGTLSSYGYVLMVLHYLVNVAQPFVSPNLQQLAPPSPPYMPPEAMEGTIMCRGYNVQFWRNENEILQLAQTNQLNHNTESLGHLLRGFFEYYAHSGSMSFSTMKGFDWGRDVLSLRSPGGLLTKQSKGWTGAKTVLEPQGSGSAPPHPPSTSSSSQTVSAPPGLTPPNTAESGKQTSPPNKLGEVKEVRHRYLFAVEDPFELDHNVARTVTHNGIVSIRDEFRRAWRVIKAAGNGNSQEDLLRDINNEEDLSGPFLRLLDDIHGIWSAKSK